MSRGVWAFKKSDVCRAIEAAQEAGIVNPIVEITRDGKIRIIPQRGDVLDDSVNETPEDLKELL